MNYHVTIMNNHDLNSGARSCDVIPCGAVADVVQHYSVFHIEMRV